MEDSPITRTKRDLRRCLVAATGPLLALLALSGPALAAPRPTSSYAKLDPTFGRHGVVLAPSQKYRLPNIEGLVVQPDGRPVVAAGEQIVRYLGNGRRDPSFAVFPRGPTAGLAVDGSGDLLRVSGDSIERLRPNGVEDPTFGGGGQVSIPNVTFTALAVQPDEKIVAAGTINPGAELFLIRLLPDGSPDPEFGLDGTVRTALAPPPEIVPIAPAGIHLGPGAVPTNRPDAVTVLSDGGIAVAGDAGYMEPYCEHCTGPNQHAIVAKYTPNGQLESGFGEGGIVSTDETFGSASNLVARPGGQLLFLLTGPSIEEVHGAETPGLIVGALSPTGQWVPGFGTDGVAQHLVQINEIGPMGRAVALGPHGDLLFAGSEGGYAGEPLGFLLGALGRDGRPDPSFGPRGLLGTRLKTTEERSGAQALAVGPHGGIVVAGRMPHHIVIARYLWK